MSLTIRHLRAFIGVARTRSFGRAAHMLGVSQPALSASVKQMEEILGLKLLDRSTRSIELTAAGREFLPAAARLIADLEIAVNDLKEVAGRQRGRVVVACVPSVAARFMPQILLRFRSKYPGIAVRILDDVNRDVLDHVGKGHADVGISGFWDLDPDLEFVPLIHDTYMAVLPAGDALARRRLLTWDALLARPFIAMSTNSYIRQIVDATLAPLGKLILPSVETSQVSTVLAMIEAGLGVTALPQIALPLGAASPLRLRPLTDPVVERSIGFITSRRRELPPAAQAFRDVCKSVLRAHAGTGPDPTAAVITPDQKRTP